MSSQITINRKWCKSCGICITFCPKKVFDADRDGAPLAARPQDCVACQLCVMRCPDFALKVTKEA